MPGPPLRRRLRAAGRAAYGAVPGPLRSRALRLVGSRLGLFGAEIGLVTVVVVVEPGDRVEECLASVRAQSHALLEVLVCTVGTAVAELPGDPRFRAGPRATTWYDAVNAAVAAAEGDHVVLVRGCDLLLPHAVHTLAGARAASGADVATGVLDQAGEPEPWLRRAQADSHPGRVVARAAGPLQAADLTLANKAFGRDAARSLTLVASDDWLCSATLARLLVTATVDVVDRPVVRWAPGRGHRSYGARPSPLPGLPRALAQADLVTAAVAGSPLEEGWRLHWYDVLLPRFVADTERADDLTWARLSALSDVPADLDLRASSRSLLWLTAHDRRADVEALAAELAALGDDVRTELAEDGHLVARWRSVELSADVRRLSDRETRLRTRVVRVVTGPQGRRADLFTRIEGVDLAEHPLRLTIAAEGSDLEVTATPDHAADRWARSRFQSAAQGAVSVEVPRGVQRLTVTARVGALVRSRVVALPASSPSASTAGPVVEGITLDQDLLVVTLDRPAEGLALGDGRGPDLVGESRRDGTVAFDLRRDLYGRETRFPTGVHRLHHPAGLGASRSWSELLPVEVLGRHHRLRVLPGAGPGELHLGPPRADDELGAYGQERLRASYAVDPRPTDPRLWYVESFAGRSATDTPLAVLEEVRRRRSDLRVVWGVVDHGQWTPPGVEPAVVGTRRWYDVLATAGVVLINTELEEWYRPRPDQLVVQCFHGYPSKAMGFSQWAARDLPPSREAVMRGRSVETWDLISTPTPEMTAVYRQQYGYQGPAAERGYPRNDALRGPDGVVPVERRLATRRLLGIEPTQTAVLYAPTWRDHLASRPRAAAMTDHLEVDRAAAALGDSHVILLRGHRFHAPGPSRPGVIDVTDHPEINDLVLASDVAVLDYSSLRFDYVLTGRPMVFLVPDLDDYTGEVRGFLFPFADTTPGPLVRTTDEVVAAVRDVPALTESWGDRLAAFDRRFNPWQDGRAAERFVDVLEGVLGDAWPVRTIR